MQIIQFLVGASYAALHSFVSYTIPIQVPAVQKVASAASTAVTAAITPAGIADLIKKYIFRAAGEEGLAENVPIESPIPYSYIKPSDRTVQYHTEYKIVPCVDTNGQTLAIWLNVLYLTPLTFLFVRFFVKSYITRTIGKAANEKRRAAEMAANDAKKGADRQLNGIANGKTNGHA